MSLTKLFNAGPVWKDIPLVLSSFTEAVEEYKQAIRIKPDDAGTHYVMGLTYLLLGDRGGALDEYKILKDLDRDLANKLFNLIYK